METTKEMTRLLNEANKVRQQRLQMQRDVEDLKEREDLLTGKLVVLMREEKVESFGTKQANASVRRTIVPSLVDEAALMKWCAKPGNEDVLKVGVVAAAWKARVASGIKVPGVDVFTRESVTVTPVKKD